MTKLEYCLRKLRELNEQDYSIGLAQDIAEAEQELTTYKFMQSRVKTVLNHEFKPSYYDTMVFKELPVEDAYDIATKDVKAFLIMPMVL